MDTANLIPWIQSGRVVPHFYEPGFIILAYLVSLGGCWTTLELLYRRTSARGYYNWYLLIASAVIMGAVGVWCMHFIGNMAIVMNNGIPDFRIQYSPGFTVGSFLLPIVGLTIAFYFFSISENISVLATLIGGLFSGLAVCGMHYMGQIGLANYSASYRLKYVLGSALIAIFASTIALGVFFHLTATWTDNRLKRGLCASLLAASVSGMHWVATLGCEYRLNSSTRYLHGGLSREATTILVICLSVGCCITLLALALIGERSRRLSANRAQQVVLACATFDPDGRLMVTPEGLLPCKKITESYAERSFDEMFNVDHAVFCWIYKASRCWKTISDVMPAIRTYIRRTTPESEELSFNTTNGVDDYSTTFKGLFCVAANDLASTIQTPLEQIGVLSQGILSTGTLGRQATSKYFQRLWKRSSLDSVEKGQSLAIFGRGQLLFVTRRVNHFESVRLQASGYRFASLSHVTDYLAQSMEVTPEELVPQLEKMRDYSEAERFLKPGVHLACFALRPIFQRGFDILVRKDFEYMLPTTHLSSAKLAPWQYKIIQSMDNWTVANCCETLRRRTRFTDTDELIFVRRLLEAISELASKIDRPFFQDARLVARLLHAPSEGSSWKVAPTDTQVLAFRIITDIHQNNRLEGPYEFASSKFFLIQQHTFKDSPDNQIFARSIPLEFAFRSEGHENPTFNERLRSDASRTMKRRESSRRRRSRSTSPRSSRWPARRRSPDAIPIEDSCSDYSEKNLVDPIKGFSGIHVSNEVPVNVDEIGPESSNPDIELNPMPLGFSTEAGRGDVEAESFADELMVITTDERRRKWSEPPA